MIGLLMKTAHDMIDVAVKSNVDLIITKMDKEEVTE
jgi:hypothetical protein